MKLHVNNVDLFVTDQGPKDGFPVVFLHGFPFSHAMWDPQLQDLPEGVRAIAFDFRGHGASDVGDGQYTIELHVDDLIGVLDALRIDRAVLCGLSMGGYVALRAVERHPGRVRGLILADTRSEGDSNEARIKRTASIKAVKTDGAEAFGNAFVKGVFWEGSFTSSSGAVDRIRRIIAANSILGIAGTLLALASRTDTTPALPRISVPTLILVGEHDALTPPASARAMHALIPGSELQIIPGAGHMANLENPALFNEHLRTFLRSKF